MRNEEVGRRRLDRARGGQRVELLLTKVADVLTVRCELDDARVAVSIRHVEVSIGVNGHHRRFAEVLPIVTGLKLCT